MNTTWGAKTVSTYFDHHEGQDSPGVYRWESFTLTDVGIDSSIIYRTTYFTPDLIVTSVLNWTNNTKIPTADVRSDESSAAGLFQVAPVPSSMNIINGTGSGVWEIGSVRIADGQHLKYNLTALGGYLLVFSQKDLIDTENTGLVHFRSNASLVRNQTGEVDQALPAGTYWYCLLVRSSPEGGYVYRYWQ
jgi:hypothetical protein